jgi:hypothetical protein
MLDCDRSLAPRTTSSIDNDAEDGYDSVITVLSEKKMEMK